MTADDMSATSDAPDVFAGAEPFSNDGDGERGALVLHGFTGNPSSMRELAEAFAAAGYHVELPRLPGHGTTVDDMLTTRWADWLAEVESAYQRLAERSSGGVVVTGLSMGGTLTLATGLAHPEVKGLICVNPAASPLASDVVEMVREMHAGGDATMPALGGDIADPDQTETAYEATPLAPLLSFVDDALTPMSSRYGELMMPLRLFTSHQDHVVAPTDSEHLAATYGGDVEHTWLERSYHVATQDYDKDLIFTESVAFADRVTA